MEQYKIAMIYGVDDEIRNMKDGEIQKIGDATNEKLLHSACLLDFAKEKYPDVQIFKRLTNRHTPDTIGYFYTLLGNILFLNTTKDEEKYGKTGFFMLPNEITEKQVMELKEFVKTIPDFQVHIFYDLELKDGMLEEKDICSMEHESPEILLDAYFEKKKSKKVY